MKKERARGGKRKPIEKDEDEEDVKKNDLNPALDDGNGDKPKEEKGKGVVQIFKSDNIPDITVL